LTKLKLISIHFIHCDFNILTTPDKIPIVYQSRRTSST